MNDPIPSETSDPIPAASMPGTSTSGSLGPPIPVASIRITAAISGDSKMNDTAAKAPAAAISPTTSSGASRRTSRIPRIAETPAQRDQRRLWAEHEAKADRGDGRQHHSRQVDGLGRAGVEALRGHVAPTTRQSHDRERDHEAGECANRQVPPQWSPIVISNGVREVLVDPLRHVVHELQEAPRGQRDHDSDDCREQKESQELPGGDRGGRGRVSSVDLSHGLGVQT